MDDSWTCHLINPQTMAGLYDGQPPLEDFELNEIRLEQRGPSCLFCGDMARFPDQPLKSWDGDARSLEVRFSLSAVEKFRAHGDDAGGTVDLSIESAPDDFGVVVRGEGDDFQFEVEGIALQIIGMKAS